MKMKGVIILAVLLLALALPSFAVDRGAKDSVILLTSRPAFGGDDTTLIVELYFFADSNNIFGCSMGFSWETDNLELIDTAVTPAAVSAFPTYIICTEGGLAGANADKRFEFAGLGQFLPSLTYLPMSESKQLVATFTFRVTDWSVADSIVLDTLTWTSSVNYKLVDDNTDDILPVWVPGNQIGGPLVVKDPTDVEDDGLVPESFSLDQNYPNPFNPTTTIQFNLPFKTDYKLTIFNILGQVVDEYADNTEGKVEIIWDASKYASGIYFYKLKTDAYTDTKKMMLLK